MGWNPPWREEWAGRGGCSHEPASVHPDPEQSNVAIRPLPVLARLTSGTQFRCKQRWRQTMKMRVVSSRYTERTPKTRAISVWLLAVPIVVERIGSWASRESTITFPEMKNAGVCGWKRSPERTGVPRSGTRSVQIILLEVREILLEWHKPLLHLVMCMNDYYSVPLLTVIVLFPFLFFLIYFFLLLFRYDFTSGMIFTSNRIDQVDSIDK